jgi:hypothetical protein
MICNSPMTDLENSVIFSTGRIRTVVECRIPSLCLRHMGGIKT